MLAAEVLLRIGVFTGVFILLAVWELSFPRRVLHVKKSYRWLNNMAVFVVGGVVSRLLFPAALVGVAMVAQNKQWGVFYQLALPLWISVLLSVVVLDAAVWLQHLVMHKVPILWRLHRMHHADQDIDVSTGLRFHPFEIIVSMLFKALVVVLLGAPVVAVIAFEVILNTLSMFNHSNVRMPLKVDACLRLFIVTPDMHRVHHSWLPQETDSNFGFNLSWWDRLFGTYRGQPSQGHTGMTIGLAEFRQLADLRIDKLLLQPFRRSE